MIYALGFGDLAASIIVLFFWSNAVRIFFCSPLALFNQFAFENVCSFHELTLFQYLRLELIYGVALYAGVFGMSKIQIQKQITTH